MTRPQVNARLLVAPPTYPERVVRGARPHPTDPAWLASVAWPPPRAWFDGGDPPPADCAFEISDDGRVRGRFYTRGARLGSFTPKPSPSRYDRFHTRPCEVAGGGTIDVGVVSVEHRPILASAAPAPAASAFPIVARACDDTHGGYICGALRPGLSRGQVDELRRLGGLSGAWFHDGTAYDVLGVAVAEPAMPVIAPSGKALNKMTAAYIVERDRARQAAVDQAGALDELDGLVAQLTAAGSCADQRVVAARIAAWRARQASRAGARLAALDAADYGAAR